MGGKITIISYDLFLKFTEELSKMSIHVLIADESHFLKSSSAKRTKAILPLIRKVRRAILLTGTPALSRPSELYTQISSLRPKLFGSWNEFAYRYCDAKPGRWALDASGASNLSELRCLLNDVMIRRLKSEVLTQLPSKRRQQIWVQTSKEANAAFKKKLEEMQSLNAIVMNNRAAPEERKNAKGLAQLLMNQLYKETGAEKLAAVKEYLATMVDGGGKFLVFGHHIEVLDGIENALKLARTKSIRIDGSTSMSERARLVDAFQKDPDISAAVLSVTAAGTGLTFTAANAVVFAELHWTPGVMMQAEDRVHRIGQQYSVNIHYMLAKGSVDDIMWPVSLMLSFALLAFCPGFISLTQPHAVHRKETQRCRKRTGRAGRREFRGRKHHSR